MIDFIFLGSKITVDNDRSHEIKRHLLFRRKAMTNLHSIWKSRDITLWTKVHLDKAMVVPEVMCGCESWIIKKDENQRIDAFELWTARRSNQPTLNDIYPEYSLEGLMLSRRSSTLATWCKELTLWKRSWCWERLRAGKEGGNRGWGGWMASLTQWTWVWASSGSWRTGRPGVLLSMRSQRVGHDWLTEPQQHTLNYFFYVTPLDV